MIQGQFGEFDRVFWLFSMNFGFFFFCCCYFRHFSGIEVFLVILEKFLGLFVILDI